MTTATTTTFRAIFKCRNRNCKHVWALEYREEGTSLYGGKHGTRELKQGEREDRADRSDGGRRSYTNDVMGALCCPECGCNLPKGGQVQGHYSESHKCGAKCMGAVGPSCDCQCGGENHGRNYV